MNCFKRIFRLFFKPKLKFRKEYQFNDDFSKNAKDSPLNNIETLDPIIGRNNRVYPRDTFHASVLAFNKKKVGSNKG